MPIEIHNALDTQGARRIANVCPIPVDPASNYAWVAVRNASNQITAIRKVKDGITWERTVTRNGDGFITDLSVWSEI